ncbi:MAG: hypothetical protein Q7K34_00870 [archaeon]|nr:hypothetical protein [archaeon]
MSTQNIRLDSKGRVIIPNSFREELGLKAGENIVASLDMENGRIILFPIDKKAKKMILRFEDEPGTLAAAAELLAKNNVDLIYTFSRSLKRGKEAEWEIIADFSKCNVEKLKSILKANPKIKSYRLAPVEK